VLTTFLSLRGAQATKQSHFDDKRTAYNFKRRCIEYSLYGVDIDPGAVEIAKLRLWLSLVVDEDDIKNIKPLPNLDYKVVCGNSLLGYPYKPRGLNKIERLKAQFFKETRPKEKEKLHKEIDDAIYGLYKNTKQSLGYKVTMDFKINFSEVFRQKGGFDVVIANPPYVRQEAIRHLKPHLAKAFDNFYCGTADIYTYFYKCGVDLLKPVGHLCFIAPNKFMRAGYGKNTRVLLTTLVTPKLLIDFGDLPIFDATTYPSILLVEKRRPDAHDKATAATFMEAEQLERIEKSGTARSTGTNRKAQVTGCPSW
jgi:type II restriction/modification system DNA methylase subunit YeeA